MLTTSLRRILALSPKGRTTQQLVAILEKASIRSSRTDILAVLDEMRRRRLITIGPAGHWHLKRLPAAQPTDPSARLTAGQGNAEGPLYSVRLKRRPVPGTGDDDGFADLSDPPGQPPVSRLLQYYEATQRLDGRGPISLMADQHETQFQLFDAAGQWWKPSSMLTVEMEQLPPTFRYALSRRRDEAVVIGYPLATTVKDGVRRIVPVGLINACLSRSGYVYQITPQSDQVVLNPEWTRLAEAGTKWDGRRLTVDAGEMCGLGFDDFRQQLSDCMGARPDGVPGSRQETRLEPDNLAGSIDPKTNVIGNAAALILSMETSFTRGAAGDLKRLAQMPALPMKATALWKLLHHDAGSEAGTVLNPVPLAPSQLAAAEAAMAGPVTIVEAPPGTGREDVIVSIIASALADEKTVLVASPGQAAIDALEQRLAGLAPEQPVMVCSNRFDGHRDLDFPHTAARPAETADKGVEPVERQLMRLRGKAEARSRALRDSAAARHRHCILSEHAERRAEMLARVTRSAGRPASLSSRLRHLMRSAVQNLETLAPGATLDELNAAVARDRKALARLVVKDDPIRLGNDVAEGMAALFPALAARALAGGSDDPARDGETDEFDPIGRMKTQRKAERDARQVLADRPVWASVTLSVPARMPLIPGMFDYVIIDGASQCDIASALPLLARASRAVVIGDPNEIEPPAQLGLAQERHLMQEAGLPLRGMARYAQSRNTLYGFCRAQPGVRPVMLCDQFRAAPAIVGYLNDAVYHGRLRSSRLVAEAARPDDGAQGLRWTDVQGRVLLNGAGQAQNLDEASALAAHLDNLVRERKDPGPEGLERDDMKRDFPGSIAVVSPFAAQVALLRRLIDGLIPRDLQQRAGITIATSDRLRDEMYDMMLLSPVAAPGLGERARMFLAGDQRRIGSAVARACGLVHVFGHLTFARQCGIRQLAILAGSAGPPPAGAEQAPGRGGKWQGRLEAALRARGLDPAPDYPIAGERLDFALFGNGDIKLDLEVDGRPDISNRDGHRKTGDPWRDSQLKRQGWRVRRFWVHELERDMEKCLDRVERDLAG